MGNDLHIKFIEENRDIVIDIAQPDLAQLIHIIISEHLKVTEENIKIDTEEVTFDTEEFKEILISTHEKFSQEIDKFYKNIQNEIKTYYTDKELSKYIIQKLNESSNDDSDCQ